MVFVCGLPPEEPYADNDLEQNDCSDGTAWIFRYDDPNNAG